MKNYEKYIVNGLANPQTLYHVDRQAFTAVMEYRQALRTTQKSKSKRIREANPDLTAYFDFVDKTAKANPYYEV